MHWKIIIQKKLYSYEFCDDNDDLCKVVVDDLSEIDKDCEYEEFVGLVATEKLLKYFEMKSIGSVLLDDFLIMVYCLKETTINKFWWFDILDVLNYSAPRGAIFGFNKSKDKYKVLSINDVYELKDDDCVL